MSPIGLALRAPPAAAIGGIADCLVTAALIGLGVWMLCHDGTDDDHELAGGWPPPTVSRY